jgi:sialidase-1
MVQKYPISRDESLYHAFPDVALTRDGRLVCVFSECTHHADRGYSRIMLCHSDDRGRTWTPKRPLSEPTAGEAFYNCPRISRLRDGRLVVACDHLGGPGRAHADKPHRKVVLWLGDNAGLSWAPPRDTPVCGIVPDRVLELDDGRWLLAAQVRSEATGNLCQQLWQSSDEGACWTGPLTIASRAGLNLCEASIVDLGGGRLAALMRENSSMGWDCQKSVSLDGGRTWSDVVAFPLPGCHRPVGGLLDDDGQLGDGLAVEMRQVGSDGKKIRYQVRMPCTRSGMTGYTVRVLPRHATLGDSRDMGLIRWA